MFLLSCGGHTSLSAFCLSSETGQYFILGMKYGWGMLWAKTLDLCVRVSFCVHNMPVGPVAGQEEELGGRSRFSTSWCPDGRPRCFSKSTISPPNNTRVIWVFGFFSLLVKQRPQSYSTQVTRPLYDCQLQLRCAYLLLKPEIFASLWASDSEKKYVP